MLGWGMEWDEKKEMGLRIHDLNMLSPVQWCCVQGLRRGRAKFEEWQDKQNRQQNPPQ